MTGDREERESRNACGRAAAYPQADLERSGIFGRAPTRQLRRPRTAE